MIKALWKKFIDLLSFGGEVLVPRVKRRRKRKEKNDDDWTMSALLDRLDEEYGRFMLKQHRASGLHNRDRKALLRIGPFVIPYNQGLFPNEDDSDSVYPKLIGMAPPNQIFIGWHYKENLLPVKENKSEDNTAYPIHFFAFRDAPGPVCGLQKTPGVRYRVGIGFAFEDHQELNAETFVTVDFKTGVVHVPRMVSKKPVYLPGGGKYMQTVSEVCNSAYISAKPDKAEKAARAIMVAGLWLWAKRDGYYQVSTRKGKGRATFGIHPGEQVKFFKDRDKTAIATDGKRKRIVHCVREHERVTAEGKTTTVKEHLRGIRRFVWKGYAIAVTVPKFHLTEYTFSASPVDEKDFVPGRKYLKSKQLARKLANAEDYSTYSHGERASA
jgi:hypothetical protein